MHFLEAFALKLHIPLEFLMEVEIKPASSSGAVCLEIIIAFDFLLSQPATSQLMLNPVLHLNANITRH